MSSFFQWIIRDKKRLYWTLQVGGWLLYSAFVEYLLVGEEDLDTGNHAFFIVVNILLGIGFTHLYRVLISRFHLEQRPAFYSILSAVLGAVALGVCFTATVMVGVFAIDKFYLLGQLGSYEWLFLWWEGLRMSLPWFLLYHLFKLGELAISKVRERDQAVSLLRAAELENLKNQLNPHFLFNALNSIKALTVMQPDLARDMITKLSDLLRLSLSLGGQQAIPLTQELRLVRDYLELEKMRFEDRLLFSMEMDPAAKSVRVPPMILQTLVENALKHGIYARKDGGEVLLKVEKKGKELILSVKNTGVYRPGPESGIGLENLRKRLQLHYGKAAHFSIANVEGQVLAVITLNLPDDETHPSDSDR